MENPKNPKIDEIEKDISEENEDIVNVWHNWDEE